MVLYPLILMTCEAHDLLARLQVSRVPNFPTQRDKGTILRCTRWMSMCAGGSRKHFHVIDRKIFRGVSMPFAQLRVCSYCSHIASVFYGTSASELAHACALLTRITCSSSSSSSSLSAASHARISMRAGARCMGELYVILRVDKW
jgi:hypothetical protein